MLFQLSVPRSDRLKPPNEISFLEADKHSIYPQNISEHNEEIDTNNIYNTLQYVNYYIHLQKSF